MPTSNYLLYGIKYYLTGLLTNELFMDFVAVIKEHDAMLKRQLHLLAHEFGISIIPRSTLDDVGLATKSGRDILNYVNDAIPEEMQQSDYKTKAFCLVQTMLKRLVSQPGNIGIIYSRLDVSLLNSDDPLLELNYIDYEHFML